MSVEVADVGVSRAPAPHAEKVARLRAAHGARDHRALPDLHHGRELAAHGRAEITRQPPKFFPTNPQWSSYSDAWNAGHMATYLKNSFIVTFVITVGQVVTAILAGYAFAFLEFPFKRTLFVVFLATLMVPFEVTIVTNVTTISDLGWYNTYAGLAVPFLATGFGAFLMRQAFLALPHDLRDAAALDGYGHCRFLTRVAVPLARPAVAALTVFAFLAAWNQYLWPLLITKDDSLRTVQIGLKQLQRVEHRPVQRHVRRRGHRGDPARDPAPGVPEAARAGPDRRGGQGLSAEWSTDVRCVEGEPQ